MGSSALSRLRSARQMPNAPSGSSSAVTTAPAQPSDGSCWTASDALPTAFQG